VARDLDSPVAGEDELQRLGEQTVIVNDQNSNRFA